MCGIFGLSIKKQKKYTKEEIKQLAGILFRLSESRGKEASGVALKTKDSIDVLKSTKSASDFIKTSEYNQFLKDISCDSEDDFLTIIGHSRLATHGTEYISDNNQPVIKGNTVCVHNGIIANDKELWREFPQIKKEADVDTEVFLALLQLFIEETKSITRALKKVFDVIKGSASVAVVFNNNYSLFLSTNTGSLYTFFNSDKDAFVFASERYILEEFSKKIKNIDFFDEKKIQQILPKTGIVFDVKTLKSNNFSFSDNVISNKIPDNYHPELKINDHSKKEKISPFSENFIFLNKKTLLPEIKKRMHENWLRIYSGKGLKRCKKCLLPDSTTFIEFDKEGVCNYCRNYKKIEVKGEKELEKVVSQYRSLNGKPDCILAFSGGRDSSYGLHYLKKVLKMNPIAFTYDWGMMTDLGRKNEAIMCGELGVEHIIVSADIREKRNNIRKNLNAWLKKPELGMVPVLMAGDKDLFYQMQQVIKKTGIKLIVDCYGEGLEDDLIKAGLAGIKMHPGQEYYELSLIKKLDLIKYYIGQYITNPSYLNSSLFETLFVSLSFFFFPCKSLHFFNYIRWDEDKILSTIINKYGWEKEEDTVATWRIDDGTASFYNYIYMATVGMTEFDTFRSIQIREGQLERKKAYDLIKEENKPRYDSIEWYCRTVGVDCDKAIKRINSIPKLYKLH